MGTVFPSSVSATRALPLTTFSLSNLEEGMMVRPTDLSQKVQPDPFFIHQGCFGTFHSPRSLLKMSLGRPNSISPFSSSGIKRSSEAASSGGSTLLAPSTTFSLGDLVADVSP